MSKEKYFLKLISEENPSIAEKCILKGLSLLEKIYFKIISEKNKKIKKVRVNVPVISIGNITAGGTGKEENNFFETEEGKKKVKESPYYLEDTEEHTKNKAERYPTGKRYFLMKKKRATNLA